MARIAGVDLPRNKHIGVSLTYIFGIGPSISKALLKGIEVLPNTRTDKLTEEEIARIRNYIEQNLTVEGDLRRKVGQDIKRLVDLGCYRGIRHRRSLPVRGQRTHTNARTRKGPAKAIAVRKPLKVQK